MWKLRALKHTSRSRFFPFINYRRFDKNSTYTIIINCALQLKVFNKVKTIPSCNPFRKDLRIRKYDVFLRLSLKF